MARSVVALSFARASGDSGGFPAARGRKALHGFHLELGFLGIGHREAFVKRIGFPLNLLTGLSGATVEGDGRVVFIIDPQSLLDNRQLFTND